MKSANFVCEPRDSRCLYWAKVVRAEDTIPLQSADPHNAKLWFATVDGPLVTAAVDGARAGREYRAKELKRDADAAHASVEGHMLDRQIAHLTKDSK